MHRIGRYALAPVLSLALTVSAEEPNSTGTTSLRRFFQQVHSYTADFQQTVRDDTNTLIQESKGRMWLQRPGKFRWDYLTPYKQQIVGDGKNVWIYDEDLQQVTVRAITGALTEGAAMLLAGQGRLDAEFNIKDVGDDGGLVWVELTPKKNDGAFERVRVGFKQSKLNTIEMIDSFGQTTSYVLVGAQENITIGTARFKFTPPPGADVVGEP